MTKQDTCLFFAPYRSEKTRRPHPSKPGVCRCRISVPTLPNAYTPNLTPNPIYPKDCNGCPFFVSRKLDFPQPTRQEELPNV